MVLDAILNPVFAPLLRLPPFWSILLISVFLTFIVTLIYKVVTDQAKMKALKDEIKQAQTEMKEHKSNPEKMMEINRKAMEKNFEYMKHSFKPMIFTMIPVLLIFGWLNAHLAYEPLRPNQPFSVVAQFTPEFQGNASLENDYLSFLSPATVSVAGGKAQWNLSGKAGTYAMLVHYNGQQQVKDVLITEERSYKPIVQTYKKSDLMSITTVHQKVYTFALFGIRFNWIWTYILISILSSMLLRKAMKVY